MRSRLGSPTDLDVCHKVVASGHHRDGVTYVAFEADCVVAGVQMLPVMAPETPGGIEMTKVVGICRPVDHLVVEHRVVVNVLDGRNGRLDLRRIL